MTGRPAPRNEEDPLNPRLRTATLVLESTIFTVVVPGMVTIWLPSLILSDAGLPAVLTARHALGGLLALVGAATYFWCLVDFVVTGRGIPAPIDHPRRLVVLGPYRYVRNPMYLGVLCLLLGEVVFFWSPTLLLYVAGWLLFVHLFVTLHEEPYLGRRFGTEYAAYRGTVNRWLPRIPREPMR